MPEVLELTHLVQQHRVAQVQIRRGGIESCLDPERTRFGEPRPQLLAPQQLLGAALDERELLVDGRWAHRTPGSGSRRIAFDTACSTIDAPVRRTRRDLSKGSPSPPPSPRPLRPLRSEVPALSRNPGTRRPRNVGFVPATSPLSGAAPASAGRRRRPRRAELPSGAVRLSSLPPPRPRVRHLGKLSAGLVLLSTAILVATRSTGSVSGLSPPPAPPAPSASVVSAPVFFFDDAENALGERFDRDAEETRHRSLQAAARPSFATPAPPRATDGTRRRPLGERRARPSRLHRHEPHRGRR